MRHTHATTLCRHRAATCLEAHPQICEAYVAGHQSLGLFVTPMKPHRVSMGSPNLRRPTSCSTYVLFFSSSPSSYSQFCKGGLQLVAQFCIWSHRAKATIQQWGARKLRSNQLMSK